MTWQIYSLVAVIILLSALAMANAVQPPVKVQRRLHREAYRRGFEAGRRNERKYYERRRRVELLTAGRQADARPDADGSARISRVQIHRRSDL